MVAGAAYNMSGMPSASCVGGTTVSARRLPRPRSKVAPTELQEWHLPRPRPEVVPI